MKVTAGKPYSFCVTVVTDGSRSGLLFERKKAGEAKPLYGYFWLKEPEGHGPTPIIREKCGDNCHGLERAEYHQDKPKKFARLYIQERIFREILDYAKAAGETGNIKAERPLTQDYTDDTRGYAQILHRFFYADPPYELAEFLDGLDIFTGYVLRKPEGKACLVGMAEEFAVRSPYNLFPEDNLDLLFTAEDLLEAKHPPPAEWFRPSGPVISDFRDGRVHPHKIVNVLKKELLGNRFYLLEGDAATGKTVIVRSLIHDLYEEGHTNVYYFDIAPRRYFSETQLVREIRAVKGVIVVENMHLEPHKVQLIYQKIKHDPNIHILFTARPSYGEFQDEFSLPKLTEIERRTIEPFEEVEGVIDCFCSHSKTPRLVRDIVRDKFDEILRVAEDDYWLLAFALQGCADNDGKGEPLSWIAHKVNKYLRYLETCEDLYDDQYPCVLLALSPLYKNEVLTAEHYLIKKLGFTKPALNDLAKRGEITSQKDACKNTLYGLPHSSRADAYWEHGREYIKQKKLRLYEEFIYDYAKSDVPNGLGAVVEVEKKAREQLLTRLHAEDLLTAVVERENSLENVSFSIECACDNDLLMSSELLRIIAEKIATHESLVDAGLCFNAITVANKAVGRKLWKLLDKEKLAHRLSKTRDLKRAGGCIFCITLCDNRAGTELCEFLNLQELRQTMMMGEAETAYAFVADILHACKGRGRALWENLDHRALSTRLILTENVSKILSLFLHMVRWSEEEPLELCRLLQKHGLAEKLNRSEQFLDVLSDVDYIYDLSRKVGKEFYALLDPRKVSDSVTQITDRSEAIEFIVMINKFDHHLARELLDLLGAS